MITEETKPITVIDVAKTKLILNHVHMSHCFCIQMNIMSDGSVGFFITDENFATYRAKLTCSYINEENQLVLDCRTI